MNLVVGSGPGAIAATAALLERGESVTILDAGGRVETENQSAALRLRNALPSEWDPGDVEQIRGPLSLDRAGAPRKLVFGSDFLYRDVDRLQPVIAEGVDLYRGLAEGGLSTLWGAAVLPYAAADLAGWPIEFDDLRPHYEAVLSLTGLSAERDALEARYPLIVEPTANLPASRQARRLLERMSANAGALEARGIFFGKARLAVREPRGRASECVRCGLCLYGCPYGIVYSAQQSLDSLLAESSRLRYVPGQVVRRIVEKNGHVLVEAELRAGEGSSTFEGSRVYLAAGAYASTAILLESLSAFGRPVTLRQSDHFLLPMLLDGRERGVAKERLHTMTQVFVEIANGSIAGRGVHLQVYTYNDFYSRLARRRLGPLFPLARPVFDRIVERLVLVKGYLHSEDSAAIEAELEPAQGPSVLRLRPVPNPQAQTRVRAVVALLKEERVKVGASAVRLGLKLGRPGSGAHVGGSFPMTADPGEFESDRQGRPVPFERVHVVDATVFPTVPAPTITLTVMANAHRIASESLDGNSR
jgi:choline dehydrogenase-like flavoprotein